jgi:hypothetical protein
MDDKAKQEAREWRAIKLIRVFVPWALQKLSENEDLTPPPGFSCGPHKATIYAYHSEADLCDFTIERDGRTSHFRASPDEAVDIIIGCLVFNIPLATQGQN